MLRIIDGKRYNTETAIDVLALELPRVDSRSDFRWEDTEMYLTKKGQWFLAGQGNAMSRWARQSGSNTYGPGSGIQLISPDEARSILEDHGQTELIEQYFGGSISDG